MTEQELLDYLEKTLADIRGEALAGRLLARTMMASLLANRSDRDTLLERFEKDIDKAINKFKLGDGKKPLGAEEILTLETARMRCVQVLDALREPE